MKPAWLKVDFDKWKIEDSEEEAPNEDEDLNQVNVSESLVPHAIEGDPLRPLTQWLPTILKPCIHLSSSNSKT